MRAVLDIIMVALNLYTWVIIAGAILSWLIAFGVVNIRNDFVRSVWNLFFALTEPFLRPIRNFLPSTGRRRHFPDHPPARRHAARADHHLLHLSERLLKRRPERPPMTAGGRFFEDFRIGETIRHATPRTLSAGDASLYSALYGGAFRAAERRDFAQAIGYPASPIDDLLAFHIVFGKTVPDISLNAVANLGYADCRFSQTGLSRRHASAVSESSASRKIRTGRAASSMCARAGSTSAARRRSNTCAG